MRLCILCFLSKFTDRNALQPTKEPAGVVSVICDQKVPSVFDCNCSSTRKASCLVVCMAFPAYFFAGSLLVTVSA